MTGECEPLIVPSRKCCCPLRQRGTGRACAACLKMCWRTSLTGNCLPLSWALELGSMLYVLPRRCLLLPGSLQMSHRSAWTGQWHTEQVSQTSCWPAYSDPVTVVMIEWLCWSQAALAFACLLAASRHTSVPPMWRLCCSQCSWMPVSRGSNGPVFLRNPVMLLLPLTWCSTVPLKQHRYALLSNMHICQQLKVLKPSIKKNVYSLRVSLLERDRSSSKMAFC